LRLMPKNHYYQPPMHYNWARFMSII
jgi:hypothetical protein